MNEENRVRNPESPKHIPVVKMVNTPGLKLGAQAYRFESDQGYKKIVYKLYIKKIYKKEKAQLRRLSDDTSNFWSYSLIGKTYRYER